MNETTFDKENVYDELISPLMAQIIEICKAHEIPHVISFFIGGEDGDMLCTTNNTAYEYTPDCLRQAIDCIYPPKPSWYSMMVTKSVDA